MNMKERNNLPQVVLIAPQSDLMEIKSEMKSIGNREGKVLVYDPSYAPNVPVVPLISDQADYGDEYLLSPFEDKYIHVKDYVETLKMDKIDFVCYILQLLGAKKITYDTFTNDHEDSTRNAELGGGATNKANGNAKVKWTNSEQRDASLSQEISYSGYDDSIPNFSLEKCWENACMVAKQYHLDNDSFIRFVLRSRDPKNCNSQLKFKRTVEITEEANSTLDIAVKLKAVKVFSAHCSYNSDINKSHHAKTTFLVEF